jgi:aspartyl/asparaginyl-tRNA synthetase
MKLTVHEAPHYIGQTVTMHMILETLRDQKHMQFLIGRERTGILQLVVSKSKVANHEDISQLQVGSTFAVTGKLVEATQSKTQGIEMQVESIEIFSKAMPRPITEESGIEARFAHRVVDLKLPKWQLMMKVRSAFENACRAYCLSPHGCCVELHTPKLMGSASESGSQVFKVQYFEKFAYLAQSPQFYKQMGVASGLTGVFEIGPVFRAEESHSSRHMTEFTGLDVEFAWAFKTEDVMYFEYRMLQHAFGALAPYAEEVKELFSVDLPVYPSVRYITLAEAKETVKQRGINLPASADLSDEAERVLYEIMGVDLIFVSQYPIGKRPFYHMWDKEKDITHSFDLIFKGIEITTGALREHRLDILESQALEKGIELESIDHYLDNFRYGCAPHGGFGLGIERVIAKLLGLSSVKEAAFVPRDPDRLVP